MPPMALDGMTRAAINLPCSHATKRGAMTVTAFAEGVCRRLAFKLVVGALGWAILGCSSEDQETQCPLVATQCGEGCIGITGRRVLTACLDETSVIGCRPDNTVGTGDVGCIRSTADGQLYWLPSGSSEEERLTEDPAWTLCTVQEEQSVYGLPSCTP